MNKSFKVIATKTIFAAAIASALSGIALAAPTEIKGDAFQTLKQPVTTGSTTVTNKSYLQKSAENVVTNDDQFFGANAKVEGVQGIFKDNVLTLKGGSMSGFENHVLDLTGITKTVIDGVTLSGNTSKTAGAALIADGSITLKDAVFENNKAGEFNADGTVKTKVNGAAIVFTSDDRITGSATFTNNLASGNGGALGNIDGKATPDSGYTIDLTDSVFSKNEAKIGGGAVYLQGQKAKFTDTVFTDNTAAAYGGAVRANGGNVEFVVTEGKSLAYTGNTTGTTDNAAKFYQNHTGGFLYLQSGAKAEFNVASDASLVIGTEGGTADSIASLYEDGNIPVIEKTGEGALIVHGDMSGFVGTINVTRGSMVIDGGVGEYNVSQQIAVNDNKKTAFGSTTLNVNGGDLSVGDLNMGGKLAVNVTEGDFTAGNITVTETTYTDTKNATKNAEQKTTGDVDFAIGANQTASVASITLNAENAAFDQTNDGTLNVAGDIKVTKGKFTAQAGSTSAANVSSEVANGITIQNDFSADSINAAIKGGIVVTGANASLDVDTITGKAEGVSIAGGASLETKLDNLVTKDSDGKYVAKTGDDKIVTMAADTTLVATDDIEYTTDEYAAIKAATGSNLKMAEGELIALDENGAKTKAGLGEILKVDGYAGRTAFYTEIGAAGDALPAGGIKFKELTLGSIEFRPAAEATSVGDFTVGSNGVKVVMRGDDAGTLFTFTGDQKLYANTDIIFSNVVLGEREGDSATYDGRIKVTGETTVTEETSYTLGNIYNDEGQESAKVTVNGSLTILGDTTAREWMPEGAVTASKYDVLTIGGYQTQDSAPNSPVVDHSYHGTLTIADGGMLVAGNHEAAAKAVYAKLRAELQAEAARRGDPEEAIETLKPTLLYIGQETHFEAVPSFAGDARDVNAYIDLAGVTNNGRPIVTTKGNAQIFSGDNGYVILGNLNKNAVVTDEQGSNFINVGSAFEDAEYDFGTSFYEEGLVKNGMAEIFVDEETMSDVREMGFNSFGALNQQVRTFAGGTLTSNIIYNNIDRWFDGFEQSVYEGIKNAGLLKDGTTQDKFYDAYEQRNGDSLRDVLKDPALAEKVYQQIVASEHNFINGIVEAEHAVTNMAALGGAFSTSFDINDQIRNTIDRRSSLANLNVVRNETGITPWVDVMGTFNSADGLYGSSGYEADIYGATLGADYTASCGAILGAAISIGQADANSVDHSSKIDNDVDFWGVSLYGSHRIGNVNGKFDIGYVSTSNDLSTSNAYFGRVKESLDADIFTIGLGAEYLANVGSLNVVPHAGIRWSSLDMDDSKYGADYDKMNLFQMPIGVTFSGTFDMTGWKVAPMFDISVVPAFGDKDAVASYTGGISESVRVVDTNPIQATLGVNASVGAWTFGVNYGLTAGSDERLNNSLNANARYSF